MKDNIVIKLGGAVCAESDTIVRLLATLERLIARGHRPVIVHGGGPQLDEALRSQFGDPVKVRGLRVTSPAAAEVVRDTLDDVGAQLVEALRSSGLTVHHVRGREGHLHAVPKDLGEGVSLGRVGTVTDFHVPSHVPEDALLVVSPAGCDAVGPLNVNADEAAVAVAAGIGAEMLVLVTDVDAVLDHEKRPVNQTDPDGIRALIESGAAQGGMLAKLDNAKAALAAGVGRVWIGRLDDQAIRDAVDGFPTQGTAIVPALTPLKHEVKRG